MTDHNDATERMNALERSVRRLRTYVGVAVVALAAVVVSGSAFGPETTKAKRIEVVSPKGDKRIVLDQDSFSGIITVHDAGGAVVARIPAVKDTPEVK